MNSGGGGRGSGGGRGGSIGGHLSCSHTAIVVISVAAEMSSCHSHTRFLLLLYP